MEEKKETNKKDNKFAEITRVVVQEENAVKLPNGDVVSSFELLMHVYNKLLEIEKKL